MPTTPAYVVDAAYNILAWNRLATQFIGDLAGHQDRNMIRWMFRRPPADSIWGDEHVLGFTRSTVADLRAGYARYPGDPEIESLVTEMLALSPRFAEMWAAHEVEVPRADAQAHQPSAGRAARVRVPGPAHRRDRPAPHRLLRRSRLPG
jgi:hypothetical protein